MPLFLQYNVNNHILDGAGRLWWPSVLPVLESVCTEQGCTEFRTPLCVILATPLRPIHKLAKTSICCLILATVDKYQKRSPNGSIKHC